MTNPVVDLIGDQTGRIVPVYPQSEKAGSTSDGGWVAEACSTLKANQGRGLADPVPAGLLRRLDLVERAEAFAGIHARFDGRRDPGPAPARVRRAAAGPARAGAAQAGARAHGEGHRARDRRAARHPLHARLPFPLTGAQQRVIGEIAADLRRPVPMHRLLQGDVGSGKTVVAVAALLAAVQGGHQGALMAPTEVLAEQHCLGHPGAAGRV